MMKALLLWLFAICCGKPPAFVHIDVTKPWEKVVWAKAPSASEGDYVRVFVRGDLDGSAELSVCGGRPVKLGPGGVNKKLEEAGPKGCVIRYTPGPIKSGVLKVAYEIDGY